MTTYARSLNNLDVTDKSGIKNYIINGDFKLDQRNIGVVNHARQPTDKHKTQTVGTVGDTKVTNCTLTDSNVLTWVGTGANPLATIAVGTFITISNTGWSGKVKTNSNGTITLDSSTPVVNATKTGLTVTTQRFTVKHICDGVNVAFFEGMTPKQFKFSIEKQEFASDDWPSSDAIKDTSTNPASRVQVSITDPVNGYAFAANTNDPVRDLVLDFHCYDIYSRVAGKTVTLSFWYKSDLNSVYQISSIVKVNTGTSNGTGDKVRSLSPLKFINVNDNWTKFTHTFTVPVFDTGDDNNEYVVASINIPSIAGNFYITAVQLESGNVATGFEPSPYELAQLASFKHLQMFEVYSVNGQMWVPFLAPLSDIPDVKDISVQLFDATDGIKIIGISTTGKTVTITTNRDHGLNVDDIAKINCLVSTSITSSIANKLNIQTVIEEVPTTNSFKYIISNTINPPLSLSGTASLGTLNYPSTATFSNVTRYGFLMSHTGSEKTNVTVVAAKAGSDEVF